MTRGVECAMRGGARNREAAVAAPTKNFKTGTTSA
jgi:hypothetical protein